MVPIIRLRYGFPKPPSRPPSPKSVVVSAASHSAQVVDKFESDLDLAKLMQDMPAIEDLLESSDDAPVIRMINVLLTQALREGASDIHIELFEQISVVRFRIDGSLRDVVRPKKAVHSSLI